MGVCPNFPAYQSQSSDLVSRQDGILRSRIVYLHFRYRWRCNARDDDPWMDNSLDIHVMAYDIHAVAYDEHCCRMATEFCEILAPSARARRPIPAWLKTPRIGPDVHWQTQRSSCVTMYTYGVCHYASLLLHRRCYSISVVWLVGLQDKSRVYTSIHPPNYIVQPHGFSDLITSGLNGGTW